MGGRRRSGSAVRAVLSALVVTSALVGPVYGREALSSVVRDTVGRAPVTATSLTLRSSVSSPDTLADVVPDDVRRWFDPPVLQSRVGVSTWPEAPGAPSGHVTWRDRSCEHVDLTAGRCPGAAGEVLLEASLAGTLGWEPGHELEVREFTGSTAFPDELPVVPLRVVGLYRQREDPRYWQGDRLETSADVTPTLSTMGTLLTDRATMSVRGTTTTGAAATWSEVDDTADFAYRTDAVGLDEVLAAGPAVRRFVEDPGARARAGVVVGNGRWLTVTSGLPAAAAAVVTGRDQVLVTVPLLAGALTALVTYVFWLAIGSAARDRRPAAAVTRLRGQGPAGVRRLLVGDLLPGVLLGLPLGLALTAVLARVAATRWFDPPADLVLDRLSATVGAAVLVLPPALTWVAALRVSREPLPHLLRSVPARSGRRSPGPLEAVLVALAVAGFVAVATGSLVGSAALAAPLLLALAGGLVAARATTAVAARLGPGRLAGRRPVLGLSVARIGRRGLARWVVPVVATATALLVFAGGAVSGATAAYERQSLVDLGAPVVLDVEPVPPADLVAAVQAVDPTHGTAAPAVVVTPPDPRSVTTLAVDTAHVRAVATVPRVEPATWDRLAPGGVAPRTLEGRRLTLVAESTGLVADRATQPVDLVLDYLAPDGRPASTPLATVTGRPERVPVDVDLPCAAGCRLVGLTFRSGSGAGGPAGQVILRDAALDGRPLDLGGARDWLPLSLPATEASASATTAPDGALALDVTFGQESTVPVHQASVPYAFPALATPGAVTGSGVRSGTLAGGTARMAPVATVAFLPGVGPRAVLVDLRTVSGGGWAAQAGTTTHVLVATEDRATVREVRRGLVGLGLTVLAEHHASELATAYGRSAAGWSLRLGVVLAVIALLAAGAAVAAVLGSGAPASRHEYAALRLLGASRRQVVRVALGELLPLVVAGSVVGVLSGHLAAAVTVSGLPLYSVRPAVDVTRSAVELPVSLAIGAAALVALVVLAVALAVRTTAATGPDRLVEAE